jgi:hypothetical protein
MHAETHVVDWLELAEETRQLAEVPGITDERREMYLRSAMIYEVEALACHISERTPMLLTEDRP